jgi:small subunit ribosomal protein S1
LPGGIDGLVHLSDISWDEEGDDSVRNYSKGEEVETIVLAIDPERERISLGIKQLDKDPLSAFLSEHPKGSMVTGLVKEVDARGAIIELAEGIDGQLRASELSRDRVEDARTVLKEGEQIEARLVGLDRKNRVISLSIKAKEAHDEAAAVESYKTDSGAVASGTTLGDLLKEQMGDDES